MQTDDKRMIEAKQFLLDLLDETLSWSCTDLQHKYAKEIYQILGDVPDWMKPDLEVQ